MTNAVSYIRMSSDKQDASPDQQRAEVAKLASKHGFSITREYFDSAVSGDDTAKRHQFRKMIADASKGGFKAIICWDQDRFGRFNSIEAGFWIHPLMTAGVELVTVAQGRIDWNDFAGRMIYSIQQEAKHGFLRDLSRNVKRGLAEAARRGEWLGVSPFGYRVEAKRLEIVEADAEIVRRIFTLYAGGLSLRGIAERFNSENLPSPTKGLWPYTTLSALLRNHAYCGTYRWGFDSDSKYDTGDATEPVEILDNHPAIVSRTTFDKVQAMLTERKPRSTPHRNGGLFVLTGILKCGYCGAAMQGKADRSEAIHYVCSTYQHCGGTKCKPNRVAQEDVLECALATIERHYLNPKSLDSLRDAMRKEIESRTDPKFADRLRKQLAAVDAKLAKATKRLIECESDMLPAVQAGIRELRAERDQAAVDLKAAETPRKRLQTAADNRLNLAVDSVSRLRNAHGGDPLNLRECLHEAVERIEVAAEKRPEGRRSYWRLASGTVIIRGGFASNLSTPACGRNTCRPSGLSHE